jgi:hypothetical protein
MRQGLPVPNSSVLRRGELIDCVTGASGQRSAAGPLQTFPAPSNLTFRAPAMDKPTRANGHKTGVKAVTSRGRTLSNHSAAINTIERRLSLNRSSYTQPTR